MRRLGDTRLWNAQESRSQANGNVQVDSIFGTGTAETLLTGLESQEELSYTGRATGNRLASLGRYSSDPSAALARWTVELESYVSGNQGRGWTLRDDERGRKFNVVVEQLGWRRTKGEKYEVRWDLSAAWGQGVMGSRRAPVPSVSPSTTATLAGTSLDSVEEVRCETKQEIEPYPIALVEAGQNDVLAKTGATRTWTIQGSVTGGETARNGFDDTMRSLVGQDKIVEYKSAFPGRTSDVMLKNYDSVREAGRTRIGDYSMQLVEGEA